MPWCDCSDRDGCVRHAVFSLKGQQHLVPPSSCPLCCCGHPYKQTIKEPHAGGTIPARSSRRSAALPLMLPRPGTE
ncbi:hypothetical protein E2C01_054916 [Portunus trituberculatus]|uniref:Uncharacterized protein n=1 Tax=Portunus trituberculatus TaxID=210409 RepID=A0A5B7GUJ5_PORTR|nr:hypothetical protein [Portunus trituberculatus]